MDPNGRVSLKEFKNFLSFVCTQVIGNHVDLATCWLTNHDLCKEVDELGTGVPCAGFSQHLAGFECSERCRAKAFHGGSTRSHVVRPGREKAAKPGPSDPALGWRSSRQRRIQRRAPAV